MWVYLLGPILSVMPRRWRRALPFHQAVPWHSAVIVSGIVEAGVAIFALIYWHSYSVTTWVSRMLDSALSQSAPTGITDHEVGFAALIIVVTHPLTWLILFFVVEGFVRLCGAFSDTVLGVFPLYLADKLFAKILGLEAPLPPGAPRFEKSHVASYVETMRDKVMTSRLTELPDELLLTAANSGELLEIRSSRSKPEWDPPRVVRYEDRYYRLEESVRGSAPRPFIYKLRRLSAGVPGRTVLVYNPDVVPVIAAR